MTKNFSKIWEQFHKILEEQKKEDLYNENFLLQQEDYYEKVKEKELSLNNKFIKDNNIQSKYIIGNFILKVLNNDYKSKSVTIKVYEMIHKQMSIINFSKDKRFKDNILFSKYINNFGTDLNKVSIEDFREIKYILENIEDYLLFG